MREEFQKKLEQTLKDTCFTFINQNIPPKEIQMIVADTFINTVIQYKEIEEFSVKQIQERNNILVVIEGSNGETLATALLICEYADNLLTINNILSTIKFS